MGKSRAKAKAKGKSRGRRKGNEKGQADEGGGGGGGAKRGRKRKASDTSLSDSASQEPDKKRARLSDFVAADHAQTGQMGQLGAADVTAAPLRRSSRVRFKPLAFWANERIAHHEEMLTHDKVQKDFEEGKADNVIVGQADQLSGWQSKLSETRISQQKKQKRKRTKKKKKP